MQEEIVTENRGEIGADHQWSVCKHRTERSPWKPPLPRCQSISEKWREYQLPIYISVDLDILLLSLLLSDRMLPLRGGLGERLFLRWRDAVCLRHSIDLFKYHPKEGCQEISKQ